MGPAAEKRTFGFAPISVIQIASTTSHKRTLPAAIGHSRKRLLWQNCMGVTERS